MNNNSNGSKKSNGGSNLASEEDASSVSSGAEADNDEDDDGGGGGGTSSDFAQDNRSRMVPRRIPHPDYLEISVESLVGTVFEMRLSPSETIGNIKARLQRLEGIPRQHMHLLHRGAELPDGASLADCRIEDGATLRLILALRGGPINTRRVPLQQHVQQQQQQQHGQQHPPPAIRQFLNSRGGGRRPSQHPPPPPPPNNQVTVLLFRDGDQINVYHVYERPDGSFTPLSSSASAAANGHDGDGDTEDDLEREAKEIERIRENAVTMNKMTDLRKQMKSLSLGKKGRKKKHGGGGKGGTGGAAGDARPRSKKKGGAGSNSNNNNPMRGAAMAPLPPIHIKGQFIALK